MSQNKDPLESRFSKEPLRKDSLLTINSTVLVDKDLNFITRQRQELENLFKVLAKLYCNQHLNDNQNKEIEIEISIHRIFRKGDIT